MTFPHGQPILLQYMISFQFGLTQLPLSDSQELYLDLPGPKERPADSDDDDDDEDVEEDEEEGKDERAEMLRVPIPSPCSVPVLGETKRSDPLETDVRENDVVITSEPGVNREVEIGIYQQECIFGLKQKIEEMKAKIAEAQKSKSPVEVAPSTPTPAITKETRTSRAEEIKTRVEELNKSLEALKFLVFKFLYSKILSKCTPFTLDLGL